jgi:hypothetical protein
MSRLNIILKNLKKDQVFDKSNGVLVLKGESFFDITIQAVEDLMKTKPENFTSISDENYKKLNLESQKVYNNKAKQYNSDSKKFEIKKEALKKEFTNLEWCWQLVGNGVIANEISHNESFKKGIDSLLNNGYIQMKLPKLTVGGGMSYLEVFNVKNPATGKKPKGLLVQSFGFPKILRCEWTDYNYNIINPSTIVAFGSEVLLHVYTSDLYGEEIEIELIDHDTFTPNDELLIGNTALTREVVTFKIHPNEDKKLGVDGMLQKGNQNKTDKIAEEEQHIQKVVTEIKIDPFWKPIAGNELKIYVAVKIKKTGAYFEDFEKPRKYLYVKSNGIKYDIPNVDVTNKPLLAGSVETNIAAHHPCKYTQLFLDYEEKNEVKKIEIFKEEKGISQPININIGIIAGENPKKFSIIADEKAKTEECNFHGKANDHAKNIFTYDKNKKPNNVKVINNLPKKMDGELFFNYDKSDMGKYFWLPNDYSKKTDFNRFETKALTCSYNKFISLTVLPDIEWELAFLIATGPGLRLKSDKVTYNKLEADLGKYKFKGIKLEDTGKVIEKGSLGYSLVIKYSINSGNYIDQISLEFIKNIERIIDTYNSVVKFLDIFKGNTSNGKSVALETSSLKKVTFDLDPPSIVFLLKWKYDYAKKNNHPVLCYTGGAGFKPLIGAKIGVDLVQNLDKFGGLVGLIVGWLIKIIKKFAKADLYIIVEVASKIDFDIGLSYNEIDGFDPGTKQTINAELLFTIKAGIKKKDVIFVANTKRSQDGVTDMDETEQESFKVEGAISTGVVYKEENGYDKSKGKFTKTEIKWTGAEMTITVILMNNNRKVNAPPNYKEKFTVLDRQTIFGPETTYQK